MGFSLNAVFFFLFLSNIQFAAHKLCSFCYTCRIPIDLTHTKEIDGVCACVWERERESGRDKEKVRQKLDLLWTIFILAVHDFFLLAIPPIDGIDVNMSISVLWCFYKSFCFPNTPFSFDCWYKVINFAMTALQSERNGIKYIAFSADSSRFSFDSIRWKQ